jgi:hypothetical protein
MKKLLPFLVLLVAVTGATIFTTTYSQVATLGPYFNSKHKLDTLLGGQVGGEVRIYKNGVDTLFVGDVVYFTTNNTVRKSTTLTDYNHIAGVVVGGTSTSMAAPTTIPLSTDTAAKGVTAKVLVLSSGRAWVRVDTMGAPVVPGALITPSIYVAGKIKLALSVPDTFHRIIGRLIDTGHTSTQALAHVNIK